MTKVYHQGETMRQNAYVTTRVGKFINPDTIVITIADSQNDKKVDAKAMDQGEVGMYYYEYPIPSDAALGKWKTEIKAQQGFIAIEQDEFTVVDAIS